MTIEHLIRQDCETLRLLANELQNTAKKYQEENAEIIKTQLLLNADEYYPPKFVGNFQSFLTSAMVLHIHGLLDFWTPRVLTYLSDKHQIPITKRANNTGFLKWAKIALSEELKLAYDFGGVAFFRLSRLSKIRNDESHNGGYVSEDNSTLQKEPGIHSGMGLYYITFEYCQDIINVLEGYLIGLLNAPKIV